MGTYLMLPWFIASCIGPRNPIILNTSLKKQRIRPSASVFFSEKGQMIKDFGDEERINSIIIFSEGVSI